MNDIVFTESHTPTAAIQDGIRTERGLRIQTHKVYVAGPMRGYPSYNFPKFFLAEHIIRKHQDDLVTPEADGLVPDVVRLEFFNPARNDIETYELEDMSAEEAGQWLLDNPQTFDLGRALTDDLTFILNEATDLFVLPEWERSRGANAEVAAARAVGIPVWTFDGDHLVQVHEAQNMRDPNHVPAGQGVLATGEVRTTSATGGQKGVKPERVALIPRKFLAALGRVYAYGANKYAAENWRHRYEFSKSLDALGRHIDAFIDGQTYDPESGEHHLAHAAFHLAALITWIEEDGEGVDNPMDDRWPYVLVRKDEK